MSKQQIRDRSNRLMATIEIKSSGKHEIRDASNRYLGCYDPRTNMQEQMAVLADNSARERYDRFTLMKVVEGRAGKCKP